MPACAPLQQQLPRQGVLPAQPRHRPAAVGWPPQLCGSAGAPARTALRRRRRQQATTCIHKQYAAQSGGGHRLQQQRQQPGDPHSRSRSGGGGGTSPLLSTPEDVVIECLTLLRRGDLAALAPYVLQRGLAPPGAPVLVAGVPVHEQGPLARAAPLMDTAARRVLPGHLLRRARILSSLQLGGSALLRVALTACTGEEVVLSWRLGLAQLPGLAADTGQQQQQQEQEQQQQQQQQPADLSGPQAATSNGGCEAAPACWQLLSCERDASADGDAEALPRGPHPRTPPELVVLGQLAALRSGDVVAAAVFNLLGRRASSSGWDAHLAAFRQLLQQPQYLPLAGHAAAELGGSALPSQRHCLQEVLLSARGGGGSGATARFLWRLGMQADGCWAVRSIEAL